MDIISAYNKLKEKIPSNVQLVAVSKTQPVSTLNLIYNIGHKAFGENKVQELVSKQCCMPNDVEWHFIGHLQTNKVKQIVSFVKLIHSVDSMKLLVEINKEAAKIKRTIDCLLQLRIAEEETKYGLSLDDAKIIAQAIASNLFENIRLVGVMGMATFTSNKTQIRSEFKILKNHFETIKTEYFGSSNNFFKEISMGMSDDYMIAIEEGATIIRVGSKIFGERQYSNNNNNPYPTNSY